MWDERRAACGQWDGLTRNAKSRAHTDRNRTLAADVAIAATGHNRTLPGWAIGPSGCCTRVGRLTGAYTDNRPFTDRADQLSVWCIPTGLLTGAPGHELPFAVTKRPAGSSAKETIPGSAAGELNTALG